MGIFDLPLTAQPGKDMPVGQDELGRTVYQTVTGQKYTMPEAPKFSSLANLPMQGPEAYAAPERMAEMGDYAASLRSAQGGYSVDDLSAAGYSPMEIAAFASANRAPTSTPINTARQEELYGTLQEPDYTMRESATARVQNALIEQVGMDPYQAGVYARRIMGDPNAAGVLESMGLIDLAAMVGGAGSLAAKGVGLAGRALAAAPAAISGLFNVEEGSQATARGYDAGSALQTGLGALQFVGGMAEMFPAGKLIAEGIARTASRMDPNTLYSVFGPPMPARAPETGSGSGRAPVTFDDVERAMQEAPLAEIPRITPSDLRDARIIPTVADLTRTGGYYTGIDASKIDVPEPMMGGPRYPLLQSSRQAGLAWAVQGKNIGTKKAGSGADLIAVTAMNPTSHQSNISFINSLIKTTSAYVRDGRIRPEVLAELDVRVRAAAAGGDPALERLGRFPGFESPNLQEFIRGASFQERSRIADIIGSKGMQELGMPNINRVLQETVDPLYAGANPRDTLLFIEPDFSAPPVDLLAEGLPVHPSYRYGIRGRVFGALDQNVSTFEMFPDFWGEKNINAFGEGFNKGGRRAFDMLLPIQEVTGRQVEELERLLQSSSNQFPVGSAMRLSPIDTRIVINSLLNKWKPTSQPVNAGGASPQAFVDAITNSKYRPSLTNYTAKDIKAGAKSGDLIAYQLGDDDVFFAIDAKPDYSWAGVDMMPGDKALVGVVSNAPGAKGTALPSVMAKAIEDGVTVLDAFAVPSERFPNGFLPTYYRKFGFEEVGRVPFDKEMYISDHGEQAYKDLLEAWRSDGWDESMGMPPVIVMRWSGNDADRTATAAGIRGAGAPSNRAAPEGIVPEARGSAGRGGERPVPPEQAGVGRGTAGGVGTGDGLRLAPGTGEAAKGLLGLTPEQLRNKGIPEDQIQQLMELSSAEDVAPQGITAYHGSPHDFDRFSMSKIGTGEGAQAYGHGLYFAENEGIARGYRDALSDRSAKLGEFVKASGEKLDVLDAPDGFYSLLGEQPDNTSYDQLLKAAQEKLEWAQTRKGVLRDELSRKAQSVLDFVKENEGIKFERNPDRGRMYEVNINANPEDFLDWDKPLSEQSQKIRDAFLSLGTPERLSGVKGENAYRAFGNKLGALDWPVGADAATRKQFYARGSEGASSFLRESGIPGIKYLDAGSRGAGEGTRNYVVFDENLINIVKKYGIAGAAAMLGVSVSDVEQALAENMPPSQWDQLVVGPQ